MVGQRKEEMEKVKRSEDVTMEFRFPNFQTLFLEFPAKRLVRIFVTLKLQKYEYDRNRWYTQTSSALWRGREDLENRKSKDVDNFKR